MDERTRMDRQEIPSPSRMSRSVGEGGIGIALGGAQKTTANLGLYLLGGLGKAPRTLS